MGDCGNSSIISIHFKNSIVIGMILPIIGFISPLTAESVLRDRLIVVDPGHGTLNYAGRIINPGKTTRTGGREHHLNIQISIKLKDLLEKEGAHVIMTRTQRDYWREAYSSTEDNKSRAILANEIGADIFLSIHCDWHPHRQVYGVTTIYTKSHSRALGNAIQKHMVRILKTKNRKVVKDSFTVLDHTEMPAIILETGFMSHRKESKKLEAPAYQNKIARAITAGVKNYFKRKK